MTGEGERGDVAGLARGGNELFALLPGDVLAGLATEARRVTLPCREVLTRPLEAIPAAYFIESGVVSVMKPGGAGERIEICMLGRESFSGIALVAADGRWPYLSIVQTEELRAIRVPAAALAAALRESAVLRDLLARAAYLQMVQIAEGLVSAASQAVPARLARWLLMYRDRLGSDRIPATHDFVAAMIGSRRTGITLALHEMEGAGMISAQRGLIVVRDVGALEAAAGRGYGVAEREQERLRRNR